MKLYVMTIITVSVLGGIVSAMLPKDNSGLKKQVNFVIGLICAIALLSPVVSIAKNAGALTGEIEKAINSLEVKDSISQGNKIIIESGTEQISKGVTEAIISKYGFDTENVSVSLTVNDDKIEAIVLEKITVTLKNEATWTDGNKVKQYVEGLVGCPVQIIKI